MLIRSRAPVRIDWAGGWTDVALFTEEQRGAVVNAAINIHSYVTAVQAQPKRVRSKEYGYLHFREVADKSVKIYSADFDTYQAADEIKNLEYDGNIDLAIAAVKRSNLDGGVELITRSNAPAGSGLGSSASMGVALVSALSRLSGLNALPYELAELASSIERHELNILGGKQDQYASVLGGINFMEFSGEEVKTSSLRLSRDTIHELEKSIVLCYTGKSRLSSNIHQNVVDAYLSKDRNTLDALKNLKQIAVAIKDALLENDIFTFGKLLTDNWENQKKLHSSITNSQIDSLFNSALKNGAIGGKACGAGGGGCLIFLCYPDKEHLVRKELEAAGVTMIDFNFDFEGLQTWEGYNGTLI